MYIDSDILFCGFFPFVLLWFLSVVGWCFLCKRLGYDAMLGLVMLIPIASLVLFLWLAFAKSPMEKKVELWKLRAQRASGPGLASVARDHQPGTADELAKIIEDRP